MNYKNKSEINREPKDKDHPYTILSNCLLNLNGYERAIMHELLSNSDGFVINKEVVMKRLEFPKQKFNDSWRSLEEKGHIECQRIQGGVKWTINEKATQSTSNEENPITSIGGSTKSSSTKSSNTNCRHLTSTNINNY